MSTALANYISGVRNLAFGNNEANMDSAMDNGAELHTNIPNNNVSHSFNTGSRISVSGNENRATSTSCSADVSKLFSCKSKHTRGQTDLVRRRYQILLNACHLYGFKTTAKQVMSPLMQTTFLINTTLVYFMDVLVDTADSRKCH